MNLIRSGESVRRNLFGQVDHEQLRREMKLELRRMLEQDSRRWNFNFETETPLPGRFGWEEIPADCTTAFYQDPAVRKDARGSPSVTREERSREDREDFGTDQENCSIISNTKNKHHSDEGTPVRRKRTFSKAAAKPRNSWNNAKITDFFVKKRRTTELKNILNPFNTTPTEAALCKTLR